MQKIKTHILAIVLGVLFFMPTLSYAAGEATIKLMSETTQAVSGTDITIDIHLCAQDMVTTVDAVILLEGNIISAKTKEEGDVLQFATEKSYDEQTKTARIVGGTPGGIQMDENGCAVIGHITVNANEGEITAKPDLEKSKTLGGAIIDPSIELTEENGGILKITVSGEVTDTTAEETTAEEMKESADILVPPVIKEAVIASGSAIIKWEQATNASMYKIEYTKKSEAEKENAQYLVIDILGGATVQYTLAALEPDTEYVVRIKSLDIAGNESDPSEIFAFKTEVLPIADLGTPQETVPDITASVIQPPAQEQTAPQPVVYQAPAQQEPFTHAASGPEHIIVAIISLAFVSWLYLRKKLA